MSAGTRDMDVRPGMTVLYGRVMAVVVLLVMLGPGGIAAASAVTQGAGASGWAIGALPTPAIAPNGHLSAVSCVSAVDCAAVGYSHDGSGVDVSLAERWDGARWTV